MITGCDHDRVMEEWILVCKDGSVTDGKSLSLVMIMETAGQIEQDLIRTCQISNM